MNRALQNSLLWQFLLRLILSFHNSQLSQLGRRLKIAFANSSLKRHVLQFFIFVPSAVSASKLQSRFMKRNEIWCQKVEKWTRSLQSSFLYRCYRRVFLWGQSSILLGWLFRRGLTGIILFILGLYVLIDYGLRDVLTIPVISSVWDEALLLLCLVWILHKHLCASRALQPRLNPLDISITWFLTVGFALMMIVSPYFSIALSGYRATVQYILWFFVVTRLLRNDNDFMSLYLTLVAVAFVISLHGIYQYIVAAPIPEHWTDQAEASVRTRVYSIFGSPNIMADFMVMFAPMMAALAYYTKNRKLQLLFWFCTCCMCLSCLFTMSRAGWMAMAVAILVFAVLVDRRLLGLMIIAGIVAMFLPFVASRIGYLFTEDFAASTSNGGRGSRWALALSYLAENPFWGVGLGMFGGAIAMQHQIYRWVSYFYVDNYYLKVLVEMGYCGFIAFILMLLGLAVTASISLYRASKVKKDSMYPLCAGMTAGLSGVLVHCYFENIFEEPYMMAYFWMIAALIVYVGFFRKSLGRKKS